MGRFPGKSAVLALDQGTTSSRAIIFDTAGNTLGLSQRPTQQLYPHPGWVNQDPDEIWQSTLAVAKDAIAAADLNPADIAAIGITNQRETTILWDRQTGKPVAPAIVWQSRQSAPLIDAIAARSQTDRYRQLTGLVPDAYFSATKIAWLLAQDNELRRRAEAGEVLFGTVDTWLLWHLTGGRLHSTDYANASRTMLFDIHTLQWSDELLRDLAIPRAMLPDLHENSGVIAESAPAILGTAIPIGGSAGDQQAALFGQTCFQPGDAKNTYGTGSFLLMNTGTRTIASDHRLLTTIGWVIDGIPTYALEGAIFVTGAAVQWLRDGLGIIASAADVEPLAASVPDSQGVFFVPALAGLGAPFWDPAARGTILGITRGTTAAHIARATLEAIAFRTRDVLEAMTADAGTAFTALRVDGGAVANDLLLQIQADLLGVPVIRPRMIETTALGAAYLAGLATGVWSNQSAIRTHWQEDRRFEPQLPASERDTRYADWRRALDRASAWSM